MSQTQEGLRAFQRARLLTLFLAACLIGVVVSNSVLIQQFFRVAPWSLLGVVLWLFFGLWVLSVIGLLWLRPWGFYSAYALVPVSTVLLGIALVPFVTGLLPRLEWRMWTVLILNIGFLGATVFAHWSYRRHLVATHGPEDRAPRPA